MFEPRLESSLTPVFTEVDDDPRQVEYIEMKVKTALHHTRLPYQPKPHYYTLNLYRGCRHGCPFCFARYSHWFLGFQNTFDFQRKIQVKVNLLEVLERELADPRAQKDWVSLGAATDPYQPAEKKYGLARGAFTLLARYRWPAVFSSKSDLLLRDLDVFQQLKERSAIGIAMTLTTLDPALKKFLEPHAAPLEKRVEALRRLKAAGIPCGIHLMPIIPFLTDSWESIEGLVRLGAEVGVDYFIYNVLRLRGAVVRDYYFNALKQWHPAAWIETRKLYGSRSYPNDAYQAGLQAKVDALRQKWGLKTRWREIFGERQMDLFRGEKKAPEGASGA